MRKSVDTYSVPGPWLVTSDQLPDPSNLDLSISVNGEVPAKGEAPVDPILGVAELIEFTTSFYTLYPGDVIMTGTPDGAGPNRPGDVMLARVEKIGEMSIRVGGRLDGIR